MQNQKQFVRQTAAGLLACKPDKIKSHSRGGAMTETKQQTESQPSTQFRKTVTGGFQMKGTTMKHILTLLTALLLVPLAALPASQPPDTMKASPAIFSVSDPVQPGEVVMVSGANFGDSPRVEISWLQDKEPGQPVVGAPSVRKSAVITPLQVTASSVKFLIPEGWKAGVYSFKVSAGGSMSVPVLVNAPDPWWQQGDWGREASPGSWLRVFGKCLSLNGKAIIALRGGSKTLMLTPTQQDTWSLNVTLPANMLAGEYETWVHNGCGGPAGWKQVGAVTIKEHPPLWKSDVFDVRDYGATGNTIKIGRAHV